MSNEAQNALIAIPALPLLASVLVALFGKSIFGSKSHYPVVLAIGGSFLLSLFLLFTVRSHVESAPEALPAGKRR